jgi:hypothetical protein
MAIVYRLLDDGGFVAGDTATEHTCYAYPTSDSATKAKRNPAQIAIQMMAHENAFRPTVRNFVRVHASIAESDARNWKRLNEKGGSRFPV